jgi:hypothetical protein
MTEIIAVKRKHIQILGIVLSSIFGIFILFVYATAPRSIGELRTKAGETVSQAINSGQVLTGTYQVDERKFLQGLSLFRSEDHLSARALFDEADPEKRDGRTQFYIAYSFYRQGWGRFSSDDELYKRGVEAAQRAQSLLGGGFVSDDQDLKLKTPAALLNELEEGLRVTADDFNPLRALNERK